MRFRKAVLWGSGMKDFAFSQDDGQAKKQQSTERGR